MTDTLPKPADAAAAGSPKRLFIKTYGCQMNVYDSERMADVLRPLGYAATDTPGQLDYSGFARVTNGLAQVIAALASE